MQILYNILQEWGGSFRLIPHFSKFFWLHPYLFWGPDKSQWWRLGPVLNFAIAEGHIKRCDNSPWLYVTPKLLFRLRGLTLSTKQWSRLKIGPPTHCQMIHRVAHQLQPLASTLSIAIDESIRESSLPGAWGAQTSPVADILVESSDRSMPRLWIECERNTKSKKNYLRKLNNISGNSMILYLTPNEAMLHKLLYRLPEILTPKSRLMVFSEIPGTKWMKRYARQLAKVNNGEQTSLFYH